MSVLHSRNCVTSSRTLQPLGPIASALVVVVSVSDMTRNIRASGNVPQIRSVLRSCSHEPTVPGRHPPTIVTAAMTACFLAMCARSWWRRWRRRVPLSCSPTVHILPNSRRALRNSRPARSTKSRLRGSPSRSSSRAVRACCTARPRHFFTSARRTSGTRRLRRHSCLRARCSPASRRRHASRARMAACGGRPSRRTAVRSPRPTIAPRRSGMGRPIATS